MLTSKRYTTCGTVIAGAAGFSSHIWADQGDRLAMSWVWIHPYERGQGLLWGRWKDLESEYGQFLIADPYSMAMVGFLTAHRDEIGPERGTRSCRKQIYGTDQPVSCRAYDPPVPDPNVMPALAPRRGRSIGS